jgi:acyl-CoA reductase-like NAD-dependent aldehyde dehydrogenase
MQACFMPVHDCHLHCVAAPQDADLELTAKNIIKGGYSYSGQRCTAVKLVLAHEAIADKLVEKVCSACQMIVTS